MSMGQCICGNIIQDSDLVADVVDGLAYRCSACKKIIYYYNDPRGKAQPAANSLKLATPVTHRKLKLKACPFCGSSKVKFMDEDMIDNKYRKVSLWPKGIACDNCETQIMFFEEGQNIGFYDRETGKHKIADRWNIRTFV